MATTTLARRIRRIGVVQGTKGLVLDPDVVPEHVIPLLRTEMKRRRVLARTKQQRSRTRA
jgi:hypothetical protein